MKFKVWESTTDSFESIDCVGSGFMYLGYIVVYVDKDTVYLSNQEDFDRANLVISNLVYDLVKM